MPRLLLLLLLAAPAFAQQKKGGGQPPPIQPTAEDLAKVKARVGEIESLLKGVDANPDMLADVAVYGKAGQFLLEFPQTFFTQEGIDQALSVLDQGIDRARQLKSGSKPWLDGKGRKVLGHWSELDGSVQPMGVTIPESYDGSKPARLYVWLHGRDQRLSEASFIYRFPNVPTGLTYKTADLGQITLDVYGRWNNANHWAGEVDVYEAIAAVQRRFKIDPNRIILRGFSLGGAGAWHIALHNPDRFAAAEIGAGTYPRRAEMPGFPPFQAATLRIWENIIDWSLNAYNFPLLGHDGDMDTQVSAIPPMPQGAATRGQLESSLRVKAQLEKEGVLGEAPASFFISENTGHGVSPQVREQLDALLKKWGDRGRVSPDHVRFLTYTTRYNRAHWVSVEALDKHYERAEVDAIRDAARTSYRIKTKNLNLLTLREAGAASEIEIDGQKLRVKGAPELLLERTDAAWRVARSKPKGLRKTHALQGPIDDAFLDPFLLVRPTGKPLHDAAHKQALRILDRFDRTYARWYRAHPRIKDDKDVTAADFAKYNVALFGDPGSNKWIAKIRNKLPIDEWTARTLPAFIYPNPLHPSRYVVINSGLTIAEREYQSDYSMPTLGDWAVLEVGDTDTPPPIKAGLFDEFWKLAR
jgi:pimeloyl-ACP methyl ester carboxylesterase